MLLSVTLAPQMRVFLNTNNSRDGYMFAILNHQKLILTFDVLDNSMFIIPKLPLHSQKWNVTRTMLYNIQFGVKTSTSKLDRPCTDDVIDSGSQESLLR